MHADRYFDDDPPPRRSPRLYGDVGGLPCRATAARRAEAPIAEAKRRRIGLLVCIRALKLATPPIPNKIIADTLGISERRMLRYWKRCRDMELRRSRV